MSRLEVTCGLHNSDSPPSDNITTQETATQDTDTLGADVPGLSCPGSSVAAKPDDIEEAKSSC